eukprot:TRINITY_DN37176_c0_g4_i1.p1 TRINITY_DN37176_c0_g4~~TRINITY_DN37176_c0_g4_i1.p1  ORF type:complete len:701 (-),score=60.50 TRINITY_DN37176_c0_g4_i1:97-2199(-)
MALALPKAEGFQKTSDSASRPSFASLRDVWSGLPDNMEQLFCQLKLANLDSDAVLEKFRWLMRSTMSLGNLCSSPSEETDDNTQIAAVTTWRIVSTKSTRVPTGAAKDGPRMPVYDPGYAETVSRCRKWRRAAALMAATAAASVVVAAPLMFDESCRVNAWTNHAWYRSSVSPRGYLLGQSVKGRRGVPFIGEQFCVSMVTFLVTLKYCRARQKSSQVHWWLQGYVASLVMHCAAHAALPWLILSCPRNMHIMYATLVGIFYLSYWLGQVCLACVSVARLKMVKQADVASWSALILKMFVAVGFVSSAAGLLASIGLVPVWLVSAIVLAACLVYLAFQVSLFAGFTQAAQMVMQQARIEKKFHKEAQRLRIVTVSQVLSSVTTLLNVMCYSLPPGAPVWLHWAHTFMVALDVSSDAVLALSCAGMLGPSMDQERYLRAAGELVEAARQREVLHALAEAACAVTGPSVTLAALFEGCDPELLLRAAVERFRCVSWDTLRQHPYLITGGGTLDGTEAETTLYELSEPCELSACDAFLSHSWHDNGEQKWKAVTEWCESFTMVHGRAPRLWLDKVCINQGDIQSDLQCLPIFIAGCNTLLVTCGKTYTKRLWCCVELFVYMNMCEDFERSMQVCLLGADSDDERGIVEDWCKFDFRQCECFKNEDKRRISHCIEKTGGSDGFNTYIQKLARVMFTSLRRPTDG